MLRTISACLVLIISVPAIAQTQPSADRAHVQALGGLAIRAHDPSTIMKCGEEFWGFSTGRGIRSFHSHDLLTWEPGPAVFDVAPDWNSQVVPGTRQLSYWAPDVVHVGDRYLLYYSVSVFGKNTSAIALVTNATLDPLDAKFKWQDERVVIKSQASDNFNAIDPCVLLDRDGKLWMSFGSYWSGIKLIELNPETGKRIADDSPMYSLAHAQDIEASCIYRHADDYFLFVNWGLCCHGVSSTYNIRVGRAGKITGPYLDARGKDLMNAGGTLFAETDGAFVGPGHAGFLEKDGKTYVSMHFYDATRGGVGMLAIREVTWDAKGWPVLSK